jgi:hypothetical protein
MPFPHNSRGVVGRGCLENRAGGCSCLSGTQPATASRPAWQKRGDEDAEVVRRSVMPSSFTPRLSGCSYRRRKLPETLRHACTKTGTGAIYAEAVGKWGRERFMRRQWENESKRGRERFMRRHPRLRRGPVRPPGGRSIAPVPIFRPGPPSGRPVNRSRPYFPTRSALRAAGKSLPSLFSDPVRPLGGRSIAPVPIFRPGPPSGRPLNRSRPQFHFLAKGWSECHTEGNV